MKKVFSLILVAMLILGGCAQDEPEEEASESPAGSSAMKLRAGVTDPEDANIAITEFLPEKVAVSTGSEVEWDFTSSEPHSVTFFPQGETPPAPDAAEPFFEGEDPSGAVDGKTLINSGLRPLGPNAPEPYAVSFDTAGTFNYVCVIHPLMTGEITVVDNEDDADSQEEVTQRGDDELEQWLEDGRAAKKKLVDTPAKSTTQGGKTTFTVEMGTTTEHADILAFAPVEAAVKEGDRVTFVNNSLAPHTATFGGGKELPAEYQNPESPEAMTAAPGGSPQTLTSLTIFNTGWLPPNAPPGAGPPEATRSFSFDVPAAGDYEYVCLLHVPSEMVGKITAT